jgi:DNA-binding transcriptional MerR regulator
METISQLARRCRLSRTALLYYERLGLLRATGRTRSGYRVYDRDAADRLEAICTYRSAGVPLARLKKLLETRGKAPSILLERLQALDREIARCRDQQRIIARLLEDGGDLRATRTMDKERWIAILRAAGLDDAAMQAWHVEFERAAPEAHQDFLEALGIAEPEVARIRASSRMRQESAR